MNRDLPYVLPREAITSQVQIKRLPSVGRQADFGGIQWGPKAMKFLRLKIAILLKQMDAFCLHLT